MNTPSFLLTVTLCFLLLALPRRFFLFPFIMAACFVPMNQTLVFLSLDFTILRLLVLFGFLRLFLRGEKRNLHWHSFDKLIFFWVVVGSAVYTVQWASLGAFINRTGFMFDCLGMYWLFRQAIQTWDDIFQASTIFAFFALVTVPLVTWEGIQHTSFFSLFGDVVGEFHRGRYRAAGPFSHYIILGCFWATLLPLFYACIKAGHRTALFSMALLAALANIYFSASSTPILTVVAIILFWGLYPFRGYGKVIFLGACCALFFLHLIMKAPVWHLIARVNVFGGSTGWHRYFLFDNFINHASEWFYLGTQSTSHWGWGQEDITNQFVLQGVRGGIVTLLIFIVLVYNAVKIPGSMSLENIAPSAKWVSWGICVTMLGHFVTFWGISYFGQIDMVLYLTFAFVGFSLEHQHSLHATSSSQQTREVFR
jgi:hypothetical protein